jgi:Leucine-rich repeat (LRR) protein
VCVCGVFYYRQNQMQQVPEGLSALGALQTLSLSSNELTALPTLIPPAPSLSPEGDTVIGTATEGGADDDHDDDDAMDTAEDDQLTSFFKQ